MKTAIFGSGEECRSAESVIREYLTSENIGACVDIYTSRSDLMLSLKSGEEYAMIIIYASESGGEGAYKAGEFIREGLKNQAAAIIYIADKSGYDNSLLETRPLLILSQPLSPEKVSKIFDAYEKTVNNRERFFKIKKGRETTFLLNRDIIYFSGMGRKITAVTVKGSISFYGKINGIGPLPGFIKIHSSYLINTKYIEKYKYSSIILKNGHELPISQAYRAKIKRTVDSLSRESNLVIKL